MCRFDILVEKKPSGVAEQGYTVVYGKSQSRQELLRKEVRNDKSEWAASQ
jgi:hypothetical protein